MTVKEAKKEYNILLSRFNNANKYFESKDIPNQEKEKFLDAFKEIIRGLNYYLGKIVIYTNKELLEGFKDEN